ncbi:TIGR04283 family arsenosugar biosynthesis glycosyltransferase [Haloferula sp.]|uniref:TIGR04283 family arsenosugar biosynthesis glycosyltransferase n=1 Tax=Haloferula sp. TaxID=2497595 RepID=UPI003C771CBA
MTRIPEAGRNKTRLIPAFGEEGAARIHDRLARHAIGRASAYALLSPDTELEVRVTGGSTMLARDWLGDGCFKIQGEGDLGARLASVCQEGFEEGAGKVVILGTDCPRLDESRLAEAFEALDSKDVVLGPAADGGYYLIGVKALEPRLFEGIAWGGPKVLAQTLQRVERCGLSVAILGVLPDVDDPEDLVDGEEAMAVGARVSVIIPALNEAAWLKATLEQLNREQPWQVLVADGGSNDGTIKIAEGCGATVISGARGRGAQMNLAATAATGEFLLFLHADTLAPASYQEIIISALRRPGVIAGAFQLGIGDEIDSSGLIEGLVRLRCRLLTSPYGDQGLFLRRSVFEKLGGFPEIPVMEDLRMVERLKKGGAVVVVKESVTTSGRRWKASGLVRTFLRHQLMLLAYYGKLPLRYIARMR